MPTSCRISESQQTAGGWRNHILRFYYFLIGSWLAIKWGIIEGFQRRKKLKTADLPQRTGDVAVITGGERGIGLEVVRKLLECDFHVIMGLRDVEAGNNSVETLRAAGVTKGSVECLHLDLTSFESVRTFADIVLSRYDKIHVLINNAGIMFAPYAVTKDNIESHFQVNFLSHFLLTNLLLEKLNRTATIEGHRQCRIVNVSSVASYKGNVNYSDDVQCRKFYSSYKAYYDSKLAQIVYTYFLDHKLQTQGSKVRVFSIHPGMIRTALWDNLPWFINALFPLFCWMLPSKDDGANVMAYAAMHPELENQGGMFIVNSKRREPNPAAWNTQKQQHLESLSQQLTGLCAATMTTDKVPNPDVITIRPK